MKLPHRRRFKFSNTARKKSASILLGVFVLTLLCLFALPKLQTQYSLRQFLPQDNPLMKRDAKLRERFQLNEIQPFIVTAKLPENAGNWFESDKIQPLKTLSELLKNFPGVRGTISFATLQGASYTDAGLSVGPLLESIPQESWKEVVGRNPLLTPSLISTDAQVVSLLVNIRPLSYQELGDLKSNLLVTAQASLPFAQVEIGGTPAVQTDVGRLLQSEVRNFVILGFIACFFVLALIFSNWSPLIISFIIIAVANIFVVAAMALAGYPFTILSSTIPIITTVDVVSIIIHTLLRFVEERKNQPQLSHHELVQYTFKVMKWPNFIASVTTMIGFLALLTVDVPLIRDYGVTAAGAIVLGWVLTTLMIFPLLHFLPAPRARSWAWKKARWTLYLFTHPRMCVTGIVLVAGVFALKGQDLSWSAKLFDDLPSDHRVRLSTEQIDKELGGVLPLEIQISGKSETWNDPERLKVLTQLQTDLRQLSGVGSVVGIPELITAALPPDQKGQLKRAQLAEAYFLYSLSNENPLKNFLTADAASARISLRTQDIPSDQLNVLIEQIEDKSSAAFPDLTAEVAGMGSTIHRLNNDLSAQLIFGFWHSLAAIGFILIFVFRSLRWALVSCLPNLVPPAALLGFLALTQTPIKPSVAIIFSIALGLAFNNTVYLLERLRSLYLNSTSGRLNIEKTMWREANPCLISSITLLAGFSVFMASYFTMNRIFGFYMVLSMVAGLVGDLVLLPTLIKSCPWLLKGQLWPRKD